MAITSIGNVLKEYQNSPVLQRGAFRNRGMDMADSRGATGLLASSPELINAVIQNQMPMSATSANFMGFDQQPDAGTVAPNAGIINVPTMPMPRMESTVEAPVEPPIKSPFEREFRQKDKIYPEGITSADIIADAKAAKEAKEAKEAEKTSVKGPKGNKKSKPDAALDEFTARLSELRGTKQSKSKKARLKDAKDFLEEAGVSNVDDIRTSKDFMLMTLGLNIAAGQSGDFLTNVVGGAKETLGTFGELKAKEKDSERAINLAAAEMAGAEYDAAANRGAKLDEAELALLTEKYKASLGSSDMKDARIIQVETGGTIAEALKKVQAGSNTAKSTKFDSFLRELRGAYKNANPGVLVLMAGNGSYIKTILENQGLPGLATILGVEKISQAEADALAAGADEIEKDSQSTENDDSGDGIKIVPKGE